MSLSATILKPMSMHSSAQTTMKMHNRIILFKVFREVIVIAEIAESLLYLGFALAAAGKLTV